MKYIKNELITIQKCEEFKNRLLIAIDGGNVFTKVLFLNKTNKEQLFNDSETFLILQLSLFHTEDFEYAIEWIRDNAYIPEDSTYSIHVTGSHATQNQTKIKSILSKNVLYIDEFLAVAAGCKSAIEYIGVDNLLIKSDESNPFGEIDNEMINKLIDSWQKKIISANNLHSSLFHIQGSRSLTYHFNEKNMCSFLDILHPAGQTFLGLSKCILNTNNYNEIVKLASEGNPSNVDTLCKEMFDSDIDSPYGKFPPDMPLFPFGKLMDYTKEMEIPNKKDLALSLIYFHCTILLMYCSEICLIKKISKVYLSGGIFTADIFQREFNSIPFLKIGLVKFEILDFVYSGVLGAMICDANNTKGHINNL